MTEPELFGVIVDYIRSEKLKDLEDEGMSSLLLLHDLVEDLLTATHTAHAVLEDEDAELQEDIDPQHDISSPISTKTLITGSDVDKVQSTSEAPLQAKSTTPVRDSVKGASVSTSLCVSDQVGKTY